MARSNIRQHQPLRVPQGWTEQDRSLVIQLENLFDEVYNITSRLRDTMVTDVGYDETSKYLTKKISGAVSEIVKIATLDGNNKIPANQLPSYVDDVEEYADLAHFPSSGETDKIYVALDTGFTYRWSGSQYVRLNTYDEATQSASGLMSAADKTKLDGVEDNANNYSLPLAASNTRGGIKIGFTEDGKKYPVKLSSEQAYVEVPWQDTKNSTGTMNRVNKKLYIVGAETQATNPTTNSNANVYIGDDNCLYSNGTKVLTAHQSISGKADKVSGATNNNFAALDSNGNLKDSGHKHSDYLTSHQDISGKADKVSSATNNHFASLDSYGNLKDSGHKHSDYLTAHQDISGKADKVSSATNNNFASLDANGNLKDSGHKHSDYITDISGKADKSATVSTVTYDSTNKKITKTINGTTTDVVTVSTIKSALGSFTWGALAGQ